METITLKIKRKVSTPTLKQYVVKNGRKIHAKIECTKTNIVVNQNGCAYYFSTMRKATNFICDRAQQQLDMMGFSGVTIICEQVL